MRHTSTIVVMLLVLAMAIMSVSCDVENPDTGEADQERAERMARKQKEAYRQVGIPDVSNFKELRTAKRVMEARDDTDLICYVYIYDYEGRLHYIGRAAGYGIPYGTQMTNPKKLVWAEGHHSAEGEVPFPQMEPNGLFMPRNVSATWLLMLNPETGETEPVYIEPRICVSPIPLHDTSKEVKNYHPAVVDE